MKKIISVFIVLAVFLSLSNGIICHAIEAYVVMPDESLRYGDYSEERIIVVLDNDTSLRFKNYGLSDFPGIGCKQIINLSANTEAQVKATIENITAHVVDGEILKKYEGVALGEYKQILCIELDNPGKENVISAI